MKQKTYMIGILSFLIIIIGSLFKTMHYPGAGVLLTLGIFGINFIFFPMGLINSYRTIGDRAFKSLYFVTYLTLVVIFTGMLLKIMHWPLAGPLLLISIPFPFVVFLPVFISVTGRIENFSIYKTIHVLLLLSLISAFNGLLALNISKERLDDSIFLASVYHRTALVSENQTQHSTENGAEIIRSADEVLKLIREGKEKLMILTFSDSETLAKDPYSIMYTDSRTPPTEIMFRGKEPCLADRLEESIRDFIEKAESFNSEKVTPEIIRELLEIRTIPSDNSSWSRTIFENNWTGWALVYLGIFENNVMMLRNEILSEVQ